MVVLKETNFCQLAGGIISWIRQLAVQNGDATVLFLFIRRLDGNVHRKLTHVLDSPKKQHDTSYRGKKKSKLTQSKC
jgi:hypothetical protein